MPTSAKPHHLKLAGAVVGVRGRGRGVGGWLGAVMRGVPGGVGAGMGGGGVAGAEVMVLGVVVLITRGDKCKVGGAGCLCIFYNHVDRSGFTSGQKFAASDVEGNCLIIHL